jgi:class 3 adenylate cyclase
MADPARPDLAAAPSGTVTFLFTDIEGNTARWEAGAEAMSTALAGHDALLRTAIVEHGGHVFKTVGDASPGADARQVLGDERFVAAYATGRAMDFGQSAAFARDVLARL